jgi:hypothetical protein
MVLLGLREQVGLAEFDQEGTPGAAEPISALGERIGQPLAWMPFEFEFPTIYMMRCASYHFEVRCPPAHSPRDLRVADGGGLVKPKQQEEKTDKCLPQGTRTTLASSFARIDVPLSRAREQASSEAERQAVDGSGGGWRSASRSSWHWWWWAR